MRCRHDDDDGACDEAFPGPTSNDSLYPGDKVALLGGTFQEIVAKCLTIM